MDGESRYKIKLHRGRWSFINSQKRVAEGDERPVVIPLVVDPVVVELTVAVIEVGIRGVEVAIGVTPAAHFLLLPFAVYITTNRKYLLAEFYA